MTDLVEAVVEWGRQHQLHDPVMQFTKMNEEVGEIAHELTRARLTSPEMKDAIGDTLVTIIILADILGLSVHECLEEAYNEIKNRKGETINGSFVKKENN